MKPWHHFAHHVGCAAGLIMAGFHIAEREWRWVAGWAVYAAAFAGLCHAHHHNKPDPRRRF